MTIIEHKELKRAVSARELYEFLGVQKDFTSWIKFYISYGLKENIDYIVFTKKGENPNSLGGKPSSDYFYTIDAARELYEFLEIKEDFTHWFKRYLQYGFENITDYIVFVENNVNPNSLGGRPSVDYFLTIDAARELYEFLEAKAAYTDWCKRNNAYLDFKENVDYILKEVYHKNVINSNSLGGRPSLDYFYTIDAAKEISMLQRSDY
jgi:phage anti-repressor protein